MPLDEWINDGSVIGEDRHLPAEIEQQRVHADSLNFQQDIHPLLLHAGNGVTHLVKDPLPESAGFDPVGMPLIEPRSGVDVSRRAVKPVHAESAENRHAARVSQPNLAAQWATLFENIAHILARDSLRFGHKAQFELPGRVGQVGVIQNRRPPRVPDDAMEPGVAMRFNALVDDCRCANVGLIPAVMVLPFRNAKRFVTE